MKAVVEALSFVSVLLGILRSIVYMYRQRTARVPTDLPPPTPKRRPAGMGRVPLSMRGDYRARPQGTSVTAVGAPPRLRNLMDEAHPK